MLDAVSADRLPLVAAGVAFFVMLALAPTMIALLTVYALVADPHHVPDQLAPLLRVVPGEAGDLVMQQLRAAAEIDVTGLTMGLVVSAATVLWSMSNAVRWLIAGLNIAHGVRETRGFFRLRGLALLFALGALTVVVVGLAVVAAVPVILDVVGADSSTRDVVNLVRWAGGVLLVTLALAVMYRFGPNRSTKGWHWVTAGSTVAVVVWLAGSAGFALYLNYSSGYHRTYGTLAGVTVLLLWLYLSAFAVLLGAEIDAQKERDTECDQDSETRVSS
ncbi:YihY/virulence factor BrkB family protein [Lentzea sp. NEAU-D7]|uniref:YihY/virulence factor BrkB family protein n=1 Tax=Lentzea sp. NEAU-D7 TaxID=2994667 RepID=UPI00224AEE95|nr:YihY/virulence factor BrkB family protein [Lentzea sp. NEAU-D7]MCX2948899.1 YihY/virulence factor BrkB family protein [Lentzea sp. NEAU-D7]